MKSTEFHHGDYDVHGRLRLPFVLVRSAVAGPHRVLFVMAGASRGQGDTLLNLFIPITMRSGWGYCPVYRRCWRSCAADGGSSSRASGAHFAGY